MNLAKWPIDPPQAPDVPVAKLLAENIKLRAALETIADKRLTMNEIQRDLFGCLGGMAEVENVTLCAFIAWQGRSASNIYAKYAKAKETP